MATIVFSNVGASVLFLMASMFVRASAMEASIAGR